MKSRQRIYSRYFTYIQPLVRLPIVRTYGTTIFTIFTITIFILFAIKPTIETIIVLQKKLDNSTQVLEKLQKKSRDLSAGRQNYDNLDPSVKSRIQTAIPDFVELKSVIQTLEETAKVHNASISGVQIEPQILEIKKDNQLGSLSEVKFTFNIEGSYSSIDSILQDISRSSRLISIDSLLIGKPAEGPGVVMSIAGKALYMK